MDTSQKQNNQIISSISSFRYVSHILRTNSDVLIKDLKKSHCYQYGIFPVDVLEVRQILQDREICFNYDLVPLFSYKFAKKYFSKYPAFLHLDFSKIPQLPLISLPSIKIYQGSCFKIGESISRISVNEPVYVGVTDKLSNIIKETNDRIDISADSLVPGIDSKGFGI